jgi:Mrp family chromosome partitioning ATPase
VTNAVIAEYLNRHADQEETRSSRYIDWLQGRMDALGAQTAKSDEALAQYRGRTGLVELAKDTSSTRWSPTVAELEHALQDLSSAQATLSSVRIKQDTLREVRRDPSKINSAGEILGSKVMQDLKVQQALEQAKLAGVFATYSSDSPATAKARAAIATFRGQLQEEVQKLLDAAEREYIGATGLVERLHQRVEELKARVAQEEIARVTLRGLERRANADSDLYTTYLRQAREAIEAVSWQPVAASVVASATPPVEPRFPHNPLGPPLAIIGSALAAIMIGARTELQRQQDIFRTAMDFRGLADVRVVGAVPRVRRPMEAHRADGFQAAIESVAFRLLAPAEEALPLVMPALPMVPATPDCDLSAGSGNSVAIAVTSAVAGEGKSVLAGSLAKQFFANGARVLVIDADARRPTVIDFIQAARSCPVRLVTCASDGAMQCDGLSKRELHVLKLADMGASTGSGLAALRRLISNIRRHYDVLIIDTPPLLVVSDALAVVPECDRIVFAVKWCSTKRDAVELALHDFNSLERVRTRIVLTCVENRRYA